MEAVIGSAYADVIEGGAADETLTGSGGADTLTGGAGADTFFYAAVSESNNAGYDTITDFTTGVDRIDVSAATGSGGSVSINRGPGSSVVGFQGASGPTGVLVATGVVQGFDLITGANTTVYIAGSDGAESIYGSGGVDVIGGGGGADSIAGLAGADRLTGGAGADIFYEFATTDSNNAGYDTITDFATSVDRIDVSALGSGGAVSISRGGGVSVVGFQGASGPAGVLLATGDVQGSDLITGANTTVYISGSNAGETILGSAGNDVITGGGGRDYLTGGAGADVFRYTSVSDSTAADYDGITDFTTGVDRIDISALGGGAVSINLYGAQSVVSYVGPSGGPQGVILLNGVIHDADFITGGATVFYG